MDEVAFKFSCIEITDELNGRVKATLSDGEEFIIYGEFYSSDMNFLFGQIQRIYAERRSAARLSLEKGDRVEYIAEVNRYLRS